MLKPFLAAILVAGTAAAQDVQECDWQASARAIAEPWETNTRTFSNGKTRLALLDTVEPAAGAFWLLILSPPYSELGDRQCRVIGRNGMGFAGMDFASLSASYDPARGLTFLVPVQIYGSPDYVTATLSVTLNQATGQIVTDIWQ